MAQSPIDGPADGPGDGSVDGWLPVNGINLHYRDWGGSGPPVVLLHGLASTCHIWDLVAPILAEGFAVIAVDQRGHGQSDKPDCGYDFATVARDLLGVLEARGLEKPVIVGHSWGADVALEFAAAHPGLARGLCFVDGGMIEPSAQPGMTLAQARVDMAPPVFTGVTLEQFRQRFRDRPRPFPLPPEFEEILLANFEVLADGTIRAQLSRENHLRIIDALWEHHPPQLYPKVSCPVLILPARMKDDDSVAARTLRRERNVAVAEKTLPRGKTVWLEDSIHDVPVQRPELVADLIREHIVTGFFG